MEDEDPLLLYAQNCSMTEMLLVFLLLEWHACILYSAF